MLVYARIDPVKHALASESGPTEWVPLFSGPYQDFTEQWFAVVGAQIIVTVSLNIFLPLFPLALAFLGSCTCGSSREVQSEDDQSGITKSEPHSWLKKGNFGLAERYGVSNVPVAQYGQVRLRSPG